MKRAFQVDADGDTNMSTDLLPNGKHYKQNHTALYEKCG
jgi:hypothetical protein